MLRRAPLTLDLRVRILHDDSKHSFFVGPAQIRMERFGLANNRPMTRERLSEGSKAPIYIHIINHKRTARPQNCPRPVQFEAHVAFAVHAIVNEKVELTDFCKQLGKVQPARSSDVGPAVPVAVADCDANLLLPGFFQRREVNAPEMAVPILLHRLEDDTRSNTMADSGLHNFVRGLMSNQAPDRPHQSGIAIIPIFEALGTEPDSLGPHFFDYFRPQCVELRGQLARPLDAQTVMEPALPVEVDLVAALRSAALAPVDKSILDSRPGFYRMNRQIRRDQYRFFIENRTQTREHSISFCKPPNHEPGSAALPYRRTFSLRSAAGSCHRCEHWCVRSICQQIL